MEQPRRILVFTTNWLGDALFVSPLISALKYNFPQSRLSVLLLERVKAIFHNHPQIDNILIYNNRINLISLLTTIIRLQRERFDAAFIIKPSLTRTLILRLAGIKEIIGFDNRKSGWLLTVRIAPPHKDLHRIDYFLTILENMHLKIEKRKYEFFPSSEDKAYIDRLFLQRNINRDLPLLIINPGANWIPKRWPVDSFAELIKNIKMRLALNIIITGSEKDRGLSEQIIRKSGECVFNFAGQTSLGQLGALMREADVVLSADSGPMHIAAAVGTKVVALFGPTSASITGPYPLSNHIVIQKDVGCRLPCYESSCQDYRCMKAISVEEVADRLATLLTSK